MVELRRVAGLKGLGIHDYKAHDKDVANWTHLQSLVSLKGLAFQGLGCGGLGFWGLGFEV